jgi:putative endonuclease
MWYVYVLKSIEQDFTYIGSTNDLKRRFAEHNDGENQSTKHYKPFKLAMYVGLPTEKQARELEKYFKTGSGNAILKKRFLNENL